MAPLRDTPSASDPTGCLRLAKTYTKKERQGCCSYKSKSRLVVGHTKTNECLRTHPPAAHVDSRNFVCSCCAKAPLTFALVILEMVARKSSKSTQSCGASWASCVPFFGYAASLERHMQRVWMFTESKPTDIAFEPFSRDRLLSRHHMQTTCRMVLFVREITC